MTEKISLIEILELLCERTSVKEVKAREIRRNQTPNEANSFGTHFFGSAVHDVPLVYLLVFFVFVFTLEAAEALADSSVLSRPIQNCRATNFTFNNAPQSSRTSFVFLLRSQTTAKQRLRV